MSDPALKSTTYEPPFVMIGANEVCTILNTTTMTLWRWLKDDRLDFPRPRYLGRHRYWNEREILDWIERQPRDGAKIGGAR